MSLIFRSVMPTENKSNKIITITLALIITLAAITVIYINLPKENKNKSGENNERKNEENQAEEGSSILTIIYGDEQTNYTLEELEELDAYTGSGGYIKTKVLPTTVSITGPYEYTGVKVTLLLSQIENLPENYSIVVEASDGWTTEYNQSQIRGDVPAYNESGNITGIGGVTMILAYAEGRDYMNESIGGPLRTVYVDDGAITSSDLWTKKVVSIEIVEQ